MHRLQKKFLFDAITFVKYNTQPITFVKYNIEPITRNLRIDDYVSVLISRKAVHETKYLYLSKKNDQSEKINFIQ